MRKERAGDQPAFGRFSFAERSTHPSSGAMRPASCETVAVSSSHADHTFIARDAGRALAMRVSLRNSRKKASDVPTTVRGTADIAAPSAEPPSVKRRRAARACARHAAAAERRPRRGREIRTVVLFYPEIGFVLSHSVPRSLLDINLNLRERSRNLCAILSRYEGFALRVKTLCHSQVRFLPKNGM